MSGLEGQVRSLEQQLLRTQGRRLAQIRTQLRAVYRSILNTSEDIDVALETEQLLWRNLVHAHLDDFRRNLRNNEARGMAKERLNSLKRSFQSCVRAYVVFFLDLVQDQEARIGMDVLKPPELFPACACALDSKQQLALELIRRFLVHLGDLGKLSC